VKPYPAKTYFNCASEKKFSGFVGALTIKFVLLSVPLKKEESLRPQLHYPARSVGALRPPGKKRITRERVGEKRRTAISKKIRLS